MTRAGWGTFCRTLVLGSVLPAIGCRSEPPTARPSVMEQGPLARYVTPELAARVTADGEFALSRPPFESPEEIGEAQARELARLWARDFAFMREDELEESRGAQIDVRRLQPCGRAYYVDTPYEPIQDASVPRPARKALGAAWLFTLCSGSDVAEVSLSVSALSDIKVVNDSLRFPAVMGTDFFPWGIPKGRAMPISPEDAVRQVSLASGMRVSAEPRLIRRGGIMAANFAQWAIELEGPVSARTIKGRQLRSSAVLFLSFAPEDRPSAYAVPAARQSDYYDIDYPDPNNRRLARIARVLRRPGFNVDFEPADIIPQ
jgi:hypothetical protein